MVSREQAMEIYRVRTELARLLDIPVEYVATNAEEIWPGEQLRISLRLNDVEALLEHHLRRQGEKGAPE